MMTFFYYDNHAEAVDFYRNKLGFKVILDDGWIVIVETAPGSRLALADPSEGFLKPVKDKGPLLRLKLRNLKPGMKSFRRLKASNLSSVGKKVIMFSNFESMIQAAM
jgi:hypothetical protein